MSSEAVEYVRGIPVVKTFGQSVFSFKRFRDSIKKYEKWTVSYTKDLRIPMMGYTAAINAVFAILIAGTFLFGGVKSGTVNNTFLLNLMFIYYYAYYYSHTYKDDVCRREYNGC